MVRDRGDLRYLVSDRALNTGVSQKLKFMKVGTNL